MNTLALLIILIIGVLLEEDYYKVLNLTRNATQAEIKKSFRTLSKKYHPDVNKSKEANEIFSKISEAYDVLNDENKRQKYDRFGKEGLKETHSGHGGDPFDMFESFFGGGGGSRHQNQEEQKGEPLITKITVNLEDIYSGREISIVLTKKSVCSHCRGSGAENSDDIQNCDMCQGRGVYIQRVQISPGFIQQSQTVCPKCSGKGKIVKSQCHVCKGKKLMDDLETFKFLIEKGIPNKHRIYLYNSAMDYIDKTSSDLVFEIVENTHPFFKRVDTKNLSAEISLSLKEALLGFRKKIRHLDGRFVYIESKKITQPNERVVLKGEGMPVHEYPSEKGDLIITYKIVIPEKFTLSQLNIWKKYFM